MLPGMNPKKMQQMMQKMGVKQEEIEATEVIIKTPGKKEIVIIDPQVLTIDMMGQETLQITGEMHVRDKEEEITIKEEDIKTVMEQASCSEEEAKAALKDAKGDIAGAIVSLSSEGE